MDVFFSACDSMRAVEVLFVEWLRRRRTERCLLWTMLSLLQFSRKVSLVVTPSPFLEFLPPHSPNVATELEPGT